MKTFYTQNVVEFTGTYSTDDYKVPPSVTELHPRPEATLDEIGRACHVLGIRAKLIGVLRLAASGRKP